MVGGVIEAALAAARYGAGVSCSILVSHLTPTRGGYIHIWIWICGFGYAMDMQYAAARYGAGVSAVPLYPT